MSGFLLEKSQYGFINLINLFQVIIEQHQNRIREQVRAIEAG